MGAGALARDVNYKAIGSAVTARSVAEACPPYQATETFPLSVEACDRAAVVLRGLLDRLLLPLARAAATCADGSGWQEFGFARAEDFCRESLSRSGRWLRRLAWIGRAAREWPELARALAGESGAAPLGQEQAYQIARVATAETIGAWIECARSVPLRRLRDEVRAALAERRAAPPAPGDPPSRAPEPDPDGDDAPRVTLRLAVPGAVRACWEEVLDLHRAVSGGQATVTSFVEALVAEVQAGAHPPDPERGGEERAAGGTAAPLRVERTRRGGHARPEPSRRGDAGASECAGWLDLRHLRALFEQAAELFRTAGRGDAGEAGCELQSLLELQDRGERLLGELLYALSVRRGFARLGYGGLESYAEERLGMSGSAARERAYLARALRSRPGWREAYEAGLVPVQKMLIVVRGLRGAELSEDAEGDWAVRAETTTCKRLADEVRVVRGERWLGRREHRRGRDRSPRPLSDRAWLRSQRRGSGRTLSRLIEGAEALARQPRADEVLALRLPEALARRFLATLEGIEPEPGLVALLGERRVRVPGEDGTSASRTFSEIWSSKSWGWRLFFALFAYGLSWDPPEGGARRPESATRIYERDGWRCQAPGCSSRRHLEAHHIVYRSRGGGDEPENRVTLCRFHHQRGEHGELMAVRGRAPAGLTFRLGRRERGRHYRNERLAQHYRRKREFLERLEQIARERGGLRSGLRDPGFPAACDADRARAARRDRRTSRSG